MIGAYDKTFYSEPPTPGEPQSSPRSMVLSECGGASLPTLLRRLGGAGIARRMPFSPIQTNISMDTISVRGAQETACSGRDLASLCQATRHVRIERARPVRRNGMDVSPRYARVRQSRPTGSATLFPAILAGCIEAPAKWHCLSFDRATGFSRIGGSATRDRGSTRPGFILQSCPNDATKWFQSY